MTIVHLLRHLTCRRLFAQAECEQIQIEELPVAYLLANKGSQSTGQSMMPKITQIIKCDLGVLFYSVKNC